MITLTNRKTCMKANIPDEYIVGMTEDQDEDYARVYPYTKLHIVDSKQGHDYYIEVVESKKRIQELMNNKDEIAKETQK